MSFGSLVRGSHPPHTQHPLSNDPILRFRPDGTFQITVFSDLHFAEDEGGDGPQWDARTVEVVHKVLQHESSQLVVLNGDLISGYGTRSDNATKYLDQVLAPVVKSGLPWATTYGNHDHQDYVSSQELFKHEKRYENSLTQNMMPNQPEAGVSNYYLEVFPASGDQSVPTLILWFFDSRGGNLENGKNRPDWVDDSTVTWFKEANANLTLKHKKAVPSLAFFHIPITAMYEFANSPGVNPSREPGVNLESVVYQGSGYDGKLSHDKQFITALAQTEGLVATFSGHDHWNDWCFKWNTSIVDQALAGDGINVCYGRHTGYGGYGTLERGGRQILLRQDTLPEKEAVTWIRLENGLVPENVTLNATYGKDEYHPIHQNLELRDHAGDGIRPEMVPGLYSAVVVIFLFTHLWFGRGH